MGAIKEDIERDLINERKEKIVKAYIACLCSFLVSMVGGLVLVWWEVKYHPTNSQQWMVPFGLIFFGTPVFIWFSVFLSEICNRSPMDISGENQSAIRSMKNHLSVVDDPER